MDRQRFDDLTRAMAGGATRRRALRLVGGGLAGALLAAAGFGWRAGAQEGRQCGDLFARCLAAVGDACRAEEEATNESPYDCYLEHGGAPCRAWLEACPSSCEGDERAGTCAVVGCPEGHFCANVATPTNRVVCMCVKHF